MNELAGAEDVRMTGDDPLEQRRTAARHADYEDRFGALAAGLRPGGSGMRRIRLDDPIDRRQVLGHIVTEVMAPQRCPGPEMIPGSAVLADILVFLRERKADRNLALPGVKSAAKELLELGDVVSIGRLDAHPRAVEPCLAVAGIEFDDPIVVVLRRIEFAEESP